MKIGVIKSLSKNPIFAGQKVVFIKDIEIEKHALGSFAYYEGEWVTKPQTKENLMDRLKDFQHIAKALKMDTEEYGMKYHSFAYMDAIEGLKLLADWRKSQVAWKEFWRKN